MPTVELPPRRRGRPKGGTNRRPRGDALEYIRPRERVDRRTIAGRRVVALTAAIIEALGGPDEVDGVVLAQAARVAELTVAAEQMRAAVIGRHGAG